jgi:cold shock CspA family protein
MQTGTVKKLTSNGFGFIESEKIDFFFHHTDYRGDWKVLLAKYVRKEALQVKFDIDMECQTGPKAINVSLANGANGSAAT